MTARLYSIWWFYSRGRVLNSVNDKGIKVWLVWVVGALVLATLVLNYGYLDLPETAESAVSLEYLIAYIWLVFSYKLETEGLLYSS